MNESMVSIEEEKKRIYIDYTKDTIYSVNTQYAGNTVGLKKLALRLTILKADKEGWLAEHMLLMGVHGPNGRKTYLAGAFPSACGKTSTAMLPGETILGDDIAYFRNIDGCARTVNAESGIFGIIQNVNAIDDPVIYRVLTTPGEVIFSNILVKEDRPYWLGMGCNLPKEGVNFSGSWYEGKLDSEGIKILPAHKNARYAVALRRLENVDPELNNPEGIPEINLMSIQDFISIPLGKYIRNNLEFGKKLKEPPLVFGVNYFLRDEEGKFLNGIRDKHIWVKWMELRVHNEVEAIKSPTGWIPKYEDLRILFEQVLNKDYPKEEYIKQFTIRVPENLAKLERVEIFHRENLADDAPPLLFEVLGQQRDRLLNAQENFGDYISPERF